MNQKQRATRRRRRRYLLLAIGLLYLVSVPWYRTSEGGLRLLWGLPDWVAVSVACYALVAILNAFAWRLTDVDDGDALPLTLSERPESSPDRNVP
ncbi:MAG: hypothetical protein P8M78_07515 [Myxococcota bacterium]|nr:hypothetical protein [Myxococcota bacterium]